MSRCVSDLSLRANVRQRTPRIFSHRRAASAPSNEVARFFQLSSFSA
jgi:hypothetical protein